MIPDRSKKYYTFNPETPESESPGVKFREAAGHYALMVTLDLMLRANPIHSASSSLGRSNSFTLRREIVNAQERFIFSPEKSPLENDDFSLIIAKGLQKGSVVLIGRDDILGEELFPQLRVVVEKDNNPQKRTFSVKQWFSQQKNGVEKGLLDFPLSKDTKTVRSIIARNSLYEHTNNEAVSRVLLAAENVIRDYTADDTFSLV